MAKPFANLYRILLLTSTALLACILILICAAYFFIRETDPLLGTIANEQIIAYLRTDDPKHLSLFLHQTHGLGILRSVPEDLGLPQASSYSLAIIKRNEGAVWIAAPKLLITQEHLRSSDPELIKAIIASTKRIQFPLHSFKNTIPRVSKTLWIRPDFFASLPPSNIRSLINALLQESESIAMTLGSKRTIITFQGLNVDAGRLPLDHPLSLPDGQCQISIALPKTLLATLNTNLEKENSTLATGIRGVLDARWKENVPGTVSTSTISALLDGPLSIALHGSGRTLLGFAKSPQALETIFSAYHTQNIPIIERRIRLSKEYTWTDLMLDPKQQEASESKIGTFILKERTQTEPPLSIAFSLAVSSRKSIPYALSNSGGILSPLLSKTKPVRALTSLAYGRCAMKDVLQEIDHLLPFLLSDLPIDLRQSLFSLKAYSFTVQQSPNGLRIVIEK